jgi:hypothetical protein
MLNLDFKDQSAVKQEIGNFLFHGEWEEVCAITAVGKDSVRKNTTKVWCKALSPNWGVCLRMANIDKVSWIQIWGDGQFLVDCNPSSISIGQEGGEHGSDS